MDPANTRVETGQYTGEIPSLIDENFRNPNSLMTVEWAVALADESMEARVELLSRIKVSVPDDNIEARKDQHNISIENHMKLALEAAGNLSNLRVFSEIVLAKLQQPDCDQELAQQTLLIWGPLAEIAGWGDTKRELEEAAFAVLYPDEKRAIEETFGHLGGDEALQKLLNEYQEGVRVILEEYLDPETQIEISGRKKSTYSIWRKAQKYEEPEYSLPDYLGIRIVIDAPGREAKAIEQCYAAADIVSQCFTPDLEYYSDYIANPKPGGYRSLHVTLDDINGAKLEFQIRTAEMDNRKGAERLSHMLYDASYKITPGKMFRQLEKTQRIYSWRQEVAAEIAKRKAEGDNSLRDLMPGNILVFEFNGNLHQLAEDNTALDFAFAVHKTRALAVSRISRNGKPVRYENTLNFGDSLAIEYSYRDGQRSHTWSDDWLTKVRSKAAIKILKKAQRNRGQEQHIAAGIQEIEHAVGQNAISALEEEQRVRLAETYGIRDLDMVLRGIGAKALKPGKLVNQLKKLRGTEETAKPAEAKQKSGKEKLNIPVYTDNEGQRWELAVMRTLGCHHHIAGCCKGVGVQQSVVAVPTRKMGDFSIHRPECVNLPKDERRILECSWVSR